MKFATFIEAPIGQELDTQDWIARHYAPHIAAKAPNLRGCVYRLCRPSPGTFFDAFDPLIDPNFGKFTALIESWFSSAEDFRREMLPLHGEFEGRKLRHASYHVTPRLQLDPRIAEAGAKGARPEITSLCAIAWKEGIPAAEASARYDRHAAIALRAQSAITKYEQNIVEEVTSWSDGVIPIDAYADFSHPTVEACKNGLRATREEMQDTSGYIRAGRFSYMGDAQPIR